MSGNIYYIPIICCGQAMNEVFEGDKRIAATCSICHKTWKPTEKTTWKVEKTIISNDYIRKVKP